MGMRVIFHLLGNKNCEVILEQVPRRGDYLEWEGRSFEIVKVNWKRQVRDSFREPVSWGQSHEIVAHVFGLPERNDL